MKKKLLAITLGTSVVFALGACGNKEESKPSKQSASTDSTDSAEQIYQKSCIGCHAKDLSGATGPDLRKVGQKYDAAEIEKIIEKGRGSMSPGIIQGEDAKKVAEWLAEHK
ncbi:cytochrome c551 [Bacillus sp. FSL R9-9530]|uniref:cytochrome c551 n=1 Tax=Bacillus sp. FSL R9-9530 TaxID=2921593 RepID=UPI0030F68F7B